MSGWLCWLLVLLAPISSLAGEHDVEDGRRIYMEGVLPSGAMLQGLRGGEEVSGRQTACVSCHRSSGMGAVEGDIQVPPITGNYLYRIGGSLQATMDPRSGKKFNQAHDPYTDAALGAAIRNGVNVGGRTMSVLMPRFKLNDEELRVLTAYLKQLSTQYSPGVSKDEVHFATVITPDADPERRRILLNVLNRGVMLKNGSTVVGDQRGGRRHMVTAAEMVLGTERKWVLHVWDLHGPSETWQQQLEEHYRQEPVFALLSGLSGTTWQPVHDFCEASHIPCWLPSVDLPVDAGGGGYSMYFQRGVLLEAGVLAKYLGQELQEKPHRVVQIYREDELGLGAASALSESIVKSGIVVENRPLSRFDSASLMKLMADLGEQDAVMLWLNTSDLSLLDSLPVPKASIYLSGRLAGSAPAAIPPAWKPAVRMIYPYELPEKRQANLYYLHQWMRYNQIQLEDEPLQAEAYFALDLMSETLSEMLDNLYRDYLIERAENMISRSESGKAEQRTRNLQVVRRSRKIPVSAPGQEAAGDHAGAMKAESELMPGKSTTIYPRMSLGVSQRFASKGAYVVKFDEKGKDRLVPLTPWMIP